MNPFARFVFFAMVRDAAFVAFCAFMMMVAFSFQPALACKIGATVALLFSIALLLRARYLTEERLTRSEAWRALPPEERPAGVDGRRWARAHFETLMLRIAKGAAGTASLLYCVALGLTLIAASPQQASTRARFVDAGNAEILLK